MTSVLQRLTVSDLKSVKALKVLEFQQKNEAEICVLSDFFRPSGPITSLLISAIEDPKHARRDTCAALLRVVSKTHF